MLITKGSNISIIVSALAWPLLQTYQLTNRKENRSIGSFSLRLEKGYHDYQAQFWLRAQFAHRLEDQNYVIGYIIADVFGP